MEDEIATAGVQDVLRKPHHGWKVGLVTTCTGCVDVKQVLIFVSPAGQAELWEEEMDAILVSVPPAKCHIRVCVEERSRKKAQLFLESFWIALAVEISI